MPGCKPTDRVVVIAPYHTGPSPVGSFHRVEEPCACLRNWWCVKAEQAVIGVVAVTDDDRAVCTDIGAGDRHCAPDRCLQPIRPPSEPLALPAPSKELEHA